MKKAPRVRVIIRVKTNKGYRYVKPVFATKKRDNAPDKLKPFTGS